MEEIALSSFDETARRPQRTPGETNSLTAEREVVYAATTAPSEQLRAKNRELENTLSLGTGPLLPAERVKEIRLQASRREGNKTLQRHAFLRGEEPPTSVKEAIRQTFRLAEA